MKSGRWMVAVVTGGLIASAGGCKSLDEYRQLQMAHTKLAGEKAHLEQELYDARNLNDNIRTKLAANEDKLRSQELLASNLQAENDRLEKAVASAQTTVEELAKRDLVQDPIVIEARLPAELDSALKDFASQYPSRVVYDPKRGIVKWASDLVFALGSDVVKESATESLQAFAEIMESPAATGFDALVVGHTDTLQPGKVTRQKHPSNWHLSAHRAISVSKALQEYGIGPTRIGVMGFGEYRPIASNASSDGRTQNRRVDIYVVPAGSIGGVVAPQPATASEKLLSPAVPEDDGIK